MDSGMHCHGLLHTGVPASFPQIWFVKKHAKWMDFQLLLRGGIIFWGHFISNPPPVNWPFLYLHLEKKYIIMFNITDKIWATLSSKSSYAICILMNLYHWRMFRWAVKTEVSRAPCNPHTASLVMAATRPWDQSVAIIDTVVYKQYRLREVNHYC